MQQQGHGSRQAFIVVGLTLAIASNVASAQMAGIEFTVEPVKAEFLPMEFIHFKATVTNRGQTAVTVPEPSERAGCVVHRIERVDGATRELLFEDNNFHLDPDMPYNGPGGWAVRIVKLRPGESVTTINRLIEPGTYAAGTFAPGDYVVRASYYDKYEVPKPDTKPHRTPEIRLRIKVDSPAEAAERREFERAGIPLLRDPEPLRQFLKEHPNSVFTETALSFWSNSAWGRKSWQEYAAAVRREREVMISEPERDITYVSESIAYTQRGDLIGAIRVLEQYDGPNSQAELKSLRMQEQAKGIRVEVAQTTQAIPAASATANVQANTGQKMIDPTSPPNAVSSFSGRITFVAAGIGACLLVLLRKRFPRS